MAEARLHRKRALRCVAGEEGGQEERAAATRSRARREPTCRDGATLGKSHNPSGPQGPHLYDEGGSMALTGLQ